MSGILRAARAVVGAAALALMFPSIVTAQQAGPFPPVVPESVTLAAGKRYEAGAMHSWFSGSTYRDLWTTPIRVPVLDLQTYAGGLHPIKEGGGMQTKSLRFETEDGSEYAFRLTDKIVTSGPKELQHTAAQQFLQDEVSAYHPAAAQIAAPIVEAAGVLHQTPVFMVMPDDSALGKFRKEFAGRLGIMVNFPKLPKHGLGLGGATKIIDSPELLKLLNADAREHVDARAFLMARLTDFLINDPDRHPGQWKWARLESGGKDQWEPIALDRDQAFTGYDGVALWFARLAAPTLVTFGDRPAVAGLTFSRGFDARLLAGLERPVWDSVALDLQSRVTDAVILAAGRAMPPEYQASAPELEAVLTARRQAIPKAANEYYRMLAERVDVHGTDGPDRAVIRRVGDGLVDVSLESGGKLFFSRRFDARDTHEIVVYLHGGDDTAVVTGHVQHSILVRVIGGNGTNALMDSSTVAGDTHPTRLYDSGTVEGVSYGPDTTFDRVPWEKADGVLAPPTANKGGGFAPFVGLSDPRRLGVVLRVGVARYGYGFDDRPYSYLVKLEGAYSYTFSGERIGITADKRLESSPLHFTAFARMSNLEMINFNGYGNAAVDSGPVNTYFAVHQTQMMVRPAIALAIGSHADISLGPVVQHSATDSTQSPFLLATHPYGSGSFSEAGMQLGAQFESRDTNTNEEHTHHQVLVDFKGLYVPALMDVRSAFEEAAVNIGTSITLPLPTHPIVLFRTGAKKLYGQFPFFEAATIGGDGTLRYMDTERYAGDASLFGTSELRIPLAHFTFLVPLRAGVLGIAEAGRVYVNGSSPGGWHPITGGGFWFAYGHASPTATITRTTEPGFTGIHLGLGLNF
jgi:hypothetical protein